MKLLKAFGLVCVFTFFLGLWIGFTTEDTPQPLVSKAAPTAPDCYDQLAPKRMARKVCK